MLNETQKFDLLISHGQILIRSRTFDEQLSSWGKGNIEQGALLYKDYVVFDPLPEDAFGANVIVSISSAFDIDENCQRCIVVPFHVSNKDNVEVASATEKFKVNLNFETEIYSLYYEICEGDEIFYKFTFVPAKKEVNPEYLLDDPWGGVKGKPLLIGKI
ncbi:competence protein ComJ [Pectobacterium cacticida]|uniref:Competence protein ComJ n=1 Tax=Pectobacterium cacticida TaxID=69221 RepID=A0ABZ2G8J1_9GAMM|nr:competence protein ComJ [Pectobacterium cacticida]UYX07506.1 competence protein ComJ [Pectobacterium cacticida]